MHVFRSGDGAITFTDITGLNLPDRYPRRITVNPINSSEVYIVFSGFGTGHIFKSTNAGSTWNDISGNLPDIPFHCLSIDPLIPSHIFAGCDYGIYASSDGGISWSLFNDGLPEAVMVFDLVSSPADRSMRAYTHGHGVYKRSFNDFNTGILPGEMTAVKLSAFPCPAVNYTTISFETAMKGEAEIIITSAAGEIKYQQNIICNSGANHLQLKLEKFAAGIYCITLRKNNLKQSVRIVKLKA
jgi:hypothetical protein